MEDNFIGKDERTEYDDNFFDDDYIILGFREGYNFSSAGVSNDYIDHFFPDENKHAEWFKNLCSKRFDDVRLEKTTSGHQKLISPKLLAHLKYNHVVAGKTYFADLWDRSYRVSEERKDLAMSFIYGAFKRYGCVKDRSIVFTAANNYWTLDNIEKAIRRSTNFLGNDNNVSFTRTLTRYTCPTIHTLSVEVYSDKFLEFLTKEQLTHGN